jgi:hypothetical protein
MFYLQFLASIFTEVSVPASEYVSLSDFSFGSSQCCGSGIRDPVLFYPPDPGSGSGIRDGAIACVKKEVGSGMEQWSDPDPGSGIKHPGSATLDLVNSFGFFRIRIRKTEFYC